MRGYMAELDEVIAKETYSRLLAKSPRRFISGGLPQAIPSLSYAAYRKYYRNHYHPSVAKVFLYGNIPTQEKLDFLDKCLGELSPEWLSQKEQRDLVIYYYWKEKPKQSEAKKTLLQKKKRRELKRRFLRYFPKDKKMAPRIHITFDTQKFAEMFVKLNPEPIEINLEGFATLTAEPAAERHS